MNNIAVKLDSKGIVENIIIVGDFTPEDYLLTKVPVGIGQNFKEVEKSFLLNEIKLKRQSLYVTETDPLFFMAQRGEATIEEWQAKVQEIKDRYPYPEE